ncbi:hypothetical protein N752_07610 [Desulforamulus aquiferis]|nr:hypothetical protein N752_07610 [Desulforamulus aquiferis]
MSTGGKVYLGFHSSIGSWFGPSGTGAFALHQRDKSPGGRFHSLRMKLIVLGFFVLIADFPDSEGHTLPVNALLFSSR